ncbi:MAG TPA: TFIIB-type zinc ribbon-containing protein [Ktedonobacterales bacterium]
MPVLICPHCGSSITADDAETTQVRCPVCGAALGIANISTGRAVREAVVRDAEDDSATRAVAREQIAPHLIPVDADYQSVPSVTAEPRPFDDGVTQVSAPYNVERRAPIVATQLFEPTQELPQSAIPEAPRAPRRTLQRASLIAAGLISVAALVIAAFATNSVLFGDQIPPRGQASATSTATATTVTTPSSVFQAPGMYQINYPAGWLIKRRNNAPQTYSTLLAAPAGAIGSVNIIAQRNVSISAPDQLDDEFIRALAQTGTTPTASAPTTVSIGGQSWIARAANVPLAAATGQPTLYSHVEALSVVHGDYVYTIVEIAPAPSAAAADTAYITAKQTYFNPMLATFMFLG